MSWSKVIGQDRVKELLKRAIANHQIAHAYLFYGGEGIGKDAMAIEFARTLHCFTGSTEACDRCQSCKKIETLQHPDVRFICALPVGKSEKTGDDPIAVLSDDQIKTIQEQFSLKGKNRYHRIAIPKATFIKINSVRKIRRQVALSAFEGKQKVFIISNAQDMNAEASNSLLKTLEEPPPNTVLILTTPQKDQLLQTIVSRCQLVQLDPLSEKQIQEALVARDGADLVQAELSARLANGSYTRAQEFLSLDMTNERKEVVRFLRLVLGSSRIQLANEIERLASALDRDAAERWLRLLQMWLRDAVMLRDRADHQLLNRDHLEDLKSFVEKFPQANLLKAVENVETSIALLSKNAYLPLVFTTLALDLKNHISLPQHSVVVS